MTRLDSAMSHENNPEFVSSPPNAYSLIEALRGLGYSMPTAVADIVDNSISADAQNIGVFFDWAPDDTVLVHIEDDGCGMNEEALVRAMGLGLINPTGARSENDLGRFGMGLKTASFSQCRSLTVASKPPGGKIAVLRWDLDEIKKNGTGWFMLRRISSAAATIIEGLNAKKSGTVVIWEKLDRVVTPHFSRKHFLDLIDKVERHLSTTFHRFIAGDQRRVSIELNQRPVPSWDPFMLSNPATWSSPEERRRIGNSLVSMRAHVLPHQDRLTAAESLSGGGEDGWTSQQGFYVYRNGRLMVSGGWLGLGERGRAWTLEETYRLARIRIDFQNDADFDWKIDIRKSVARPPVELKERLIRIAVDCRTRARAVFAYRGATSRTATNYDLSMWLVKHGDKGTLYGLNWQHPALEHLFELAGDRASAIKDYLRLVETTVPIQRIWIDAADDYELPRIEAELELSNELREIASSILENSMQKKGNTLDQALTFLSKTEPFGLYPQLLSELRAKYSEKGL